MNSTTLYHIIFNILNLNNFIFFHCNQEERVQLLRIFSERGFVVQLIDLNSKDANISAMFFGLKKVQRLGIVINYNCKLAKNVINEVLPIIVEITSAIEDLIIHFSHRNVDTSPHPFVG